LLLSLNKVLLFQCSLLDLHCESLLVPDIVPENFPSRYPTLIKYVDIK
jgi:hypothetical protein